MRILAVVLAVVGVTAAAGWFACAFLRPAPYISWPVWGLAIGAMIASHHDPREIPVNAYEHLYEMKAWAEGAKSWTNMIPDPAQVAIMDAAEVVKHGAAYMVLITAEGRA